MKTERWRNNLLFLRKQINASQSDIALQVRKTQQAVGNWEKGIGQPNISELIELTNYFGISIQTFLTTDMSKSNLIEKPPAKYFESKGNLTSNPIGNPMKENLKKMSSEIPPGDVIKILQNSLADKDKIISTQDALISNLNAQITALEHDLKTAQNIYTKLKKPAYAKPAQ